MIRLLIDGQPVAFTEGATILETARQFGRYIPTLCAHPDLPPFSGSRASGQVYRNDLVFVDDPESPVPGSCNLCWVEVEGRDHPVRACEERIAEGMRISTHSEALDRLRREQMALILADHPRACLSCAQSEGCDRQRCMLNVTPEERCCTKFSYCELRKIAQFVGISRNIPEYRPARLPAIRGGKLFVFDFNLCIGCLRCVRACQDLEAIGALGFVRQKKGVMVGTIQPTLAKSGCQFCGACVLVCPTGAMLATSDRCGADLTISAPFLPPEPLEELTADRVLQVPEQGGVIQLLDEKKETIYIAGTSNMRRELGECLKTAKGAQFFLFDPDAFYTQRQNELIQHHLDEHGQMPRLNAELDDLF